MRQYFLLLEVLGPGEQVPELTVPAPSPLRLTASLSPPFRTSKEPRGSWHREAVFGVQGLNHPLSTLQGRDPGTLVCSLNLLLGSFIIIIKSIIVVWMLPSKK